VRELTPEALSKAQSIDGFGIGADPMSGGADD
jgi:hypothetical protein